LSTINNYNYCFYVYKLLYKVKKNLDFDMHQI